MNVKKLNDAIEGLKKDLGKGLVSCDIWPSGTGQAIVSFNPEPKATALFDTLTGQLKKMLEEAEFPNLNKYYMLDVDGDALVVVLQFDKYQWGMLVNKLDVNMGILISIAIPNAQKALEEAVLG